MNNSLLKKRIVEFIGFSLFIAGTFLIPFVDIFIFKNSIAEISLTEIFQELILSVIISLFFYLSIRFPEIKNGMIFISSFFACLLIRELDFITDHIQISWSYFMLAIVLFDVFLFIKHRENVLAGLTHFCKNENYYIMACGLVLVLVFSRLFGIQLLWKHLLNSSYIRVVKNAAEEVSELSGYVFCLISAVKYTGSFSKKNNL